MKIIRKQIYSDLSEFETTEQNHNDVLYFDIETTGLSAETSVIYLIGLIYFENQHPIFSAWFSESKEDEKQMLNNFHQLAQSKKTLICYNGSSFDLPFLKKRLEYFHLSPNFSKNIVIDFYRTFSPFKNLFQLENRKLPSFEKLIGIKRVHDLSGRELIPIYSSYLKEMNEAKKEELFWFLIKHNEYDLKGLFELTKLYFFFKFFDSTTYEAAAQIEVKSFENGVILQVKLPFVPNFTVTNDSCICSGSQNEKKIRLFLPVFTGELKYYYSDYKNYYYLPREDMAIHKDLAKYMNKDYRRKADAKSAYIKKFDRFIRLPAEGNIEFTNIFQREHDEKVFFIKETEFLNLNSFLTLFKLYFKEFSG